LQGEEPCELLGELVKETERFWVYRTPSGKIERRAKTYLANVGQGLGMTGFGRFRGDAREPCPRCPRSLTMSNLFYNRCWIRITDPHRYVEDGQGWRIVYVNTRQFDEAYRRGFRAAQSARCHSHSDYPCYSL
jgi:hypothetical protein